MRQPRPSALCLATCCLTMMAALALAGCSSASASGEEDWNRSYAATFDEVWAVAIEVLEDSDLEVFKKDRDRGLLRAETGDTMLELRIAERGELVVVDILTGGNSQVAGSTSRQDVIVTTTLHEIDRVLRERR